MNSCMDVPRLDEDEHKAVRALFRGEASEYQQRLALGVFVNKFARPHGLTYVPGKPDESAFMAGRAFVGIQILDTLSIPVGQLVYNKATPEEKKDV